MNRKSTNSIYKFVGFVRVCAHSYACWCVRECEIATSTQCSAKDNKKFLLDRGASHESGVIPAPGISRTPKQTHPKVELQLQLSFSLCGSNYWGVEVVTFPLLLKAHSFEVSHRNTLFRWRLSPLNRPCRLTSSLLWNTEICMYLFGK